MRKQRTRCNAPPALWAELRASLAEAFKPEHQMSQIRIARACQISPPRITDFLSGVTNLSGEHVAMLQLRCPHIPTRDVARRVLAAANLTVRGLTGSAVRPEIERWVMETPHEYSMQRWFAYVRYSQGDASLEDVSIALLTDLLWASTAGDYFSDCAEALQQRPNVFPQTANFNAARVMAWAGKPDDLYERERGLPEHFRYVGFWAPPWEPYRLSENPEFWGWGDASVIEEKAFDRLIKDVREHTRKRDSDTAPFFIDHAFFGAPCKCVGADTIPVPLDLDRQFAILKLSAIALSISYRVIRSCRAYVQQTGAAHESGSVLPTLFSGLAAIEASKTRARIQQLNFAQHMFWFRAANLPGAFKKQPVVSRVAATLDYEFSTNKDRIAEIDAAWYEYVHQADEVLEEVFGTSFFDEARKRGKTRARKKGETKHDPALH